MGMTKDMFGYISGSVNNAKGTFANNTGKIPSAVIPIIVSDGSSTAAAVFYDKTNSTTANIVMVGAELTYTVFIGLIVLET